MKQGIVLRMFRGDALDILSRELDIPAERLTRWNEAFTQGDIENLKIKPNSPETLENRMLKRWLVRRAGKLNCSIKRLIN